MGDLTAQQQFQERIADRLREDIGELIPDEVLAEMVSRAAEEAFFKPRIDRSAFREVKHPSWFVGEVRTLLQDRMKTALDAYMAKNDEKLQAAIAETVQASLAELLASTIHEGFKGAGYSIGSNLGHQLSDQMAQGLGSSLRAHGLI